MIARLDGGREGGFSMSRALQRIDAAHRFLSMAEAELDLAFIDIKAAAPRSMLDQIYRDVVTARREARDLIARAAEQGEGSR